MDEYPAANLFRVSEAAALALHAAALLGRSPNRLLRITDIAQGLKASAAHLAKVLARLERAGIVRAVRGPHGGYQLARPAQKVTLLDVYQAIEGPVTAEVCPFNLAVCDGQGCPLGSFLRRVSRLTIKRLARTQLADVRISIKRRRR